MNTNPKVDAFINRAEKWRPEIEKLRSLLLNTTLTEELKWGKPCYTVQGKNVVLIMPLKEHCVLLFMKGALLDDPKGILIKPGEETQAARQARFTSLQDIEKKEGAIKAILQEAIEVETSGRQVPLKTIEEHAIPAEFQQRLNELPALQTAFEALTPGRRRGYLMHFAQPKQSATRASRIEKCIPLILEGKGLNDDYAAMKKK